MVIYYIYWEWCEMNIILKYDGIGIVVVSGIYYELEYNDTILWENVKVISIGFVTIDYEKCDIDWLCDHRLWEMWYQSALWPSIMRNVMSIGFVTIDYEKWNVDWLCGHRPYEIWNDTTLIILSDLEWEIINRSINGNMESVECK